MTGFFSLPTFDTTSGPPSMMIVDGAFGSMFGMMKAPILSAGMPAACAMPCAHSPMRYIDALPDAKSLASSFERGSLK